MTKQTRPLVPEEWLDRVDRLAESLPRLKQEQSWAGTRWRVGQATVAHLFGGFDGLFRMTFRAEPDEVMAFEHLGPPYFKADWGGNVVGLIVDDDTDWTEIGELLTDSYCLLAPTSLADQVLRPGAPSADAPH